MILISSLAASWFLLAAEIAMFEPPANTGAALPSTPGSGKTPNTSSFQVATVLVSSLGSGARSPIDQCAHPGAMMVAASGSPVESLSLMLTHGVLSASVTGALDALWNSFCSCSRPFTVFGSDSDEAHWSPSFTASSPPLAKIQE